MRSLRSYVEMTLVENSTKQSDEENETGRTSKLTANLSKSRLLSCMEISSDYVRTCVAFSMRLLFCGIYAARSIGTARGHTAPPSFHARWCRTRNTPELDWSSRIRSLLSGRTMEAKSLKRCFRYRESRLDGTNSGFSLLTFRKRTSIK